MTFALTASEIITAWETGTGRAPLDRALSLLWVAGDEADLPALPLAERDRRLLQLRGATFGSGFGSVAICPECGAQMEVEFDVLELAASLPSRDPEALQLAGTQIELRPLNSRDLAAASLLAESEVPVFVREQLARFSGELGEETTRELDALIDAREAEGELNIALTCTDCATSWTEQLDVVDHLWREIESAARRILGEVAEIAAAFSWSEADILSMTPPRRAAYLSLARGG